METVPTFVNVEDLKIKLEELMDVFEQKELEAEADDRIQPSWYYGGVVAGVDKVYRLLGGVDLEELKE